MRTLPLIILSALAICGGASGQPSAPADAWVHADGTGALGQGFFVRGLKGCVLVTAGHVVAGADTVQFRIGGILGHGAVRVGRPNAGAPDVGIVEVTDGGPLSCPDAPAPSAIEEAVYSRGGEIAVVTQTGGRSRLQTVVVRDEPTLVVRPQFPDESVQTGVSGAALRMGQTIVGVVTAVDNRGSVQQVTVQRLDRLTGAAAAWLKPGGPAPPTTVRTGAPPPSVPARDPPSAPARPRSGIPAVWSPFDDRQLPADIQAVVREARRVRGLAEAAGKSAAEIARQADVAQAEGNRQGADGVTFAKVFRDGFAYNGGIRRNGTGWTADGYGVTTVTKGSALGTSYKCLYLFENSGICDGLAEVVYPAIESNNRDSWRGRICKEKDQCGVGVVTFKSKETWYYDPTQRGAGVTLQVPKDGVFTQRYEGTFDQGYWNGPGVVWDEQTGKVIKFGVWKAGKLDQDRTGELIAAGRR